MSTVDLKESPTQCGAGRQDLLQLHLLTEQGSAVAEGAELCESGNLNHQGSELGQFGASTWED